MSDFTRTFRGPLAEAFDRACGALITPAVLHGVLAAAPDALPVAPATDRGVWGPSGNVDRLTVNDILRRASAEREQPWPISRARDAARVWRDGDRDTWESATRARQRRVSRAAVAAAVTLKDEWIDALADGVVLLCEQSSWCWPMHDDSHTRSGNVLADVDNPFLDLGAGEVVSQLTWVDHLLAAELDSRYPGLRARIRREARVRIFEPYRLRTDFHWLALDGDAGNWTPWIHGNVLVAALRLLDSPAEADLRAEIVARAIEGIDRFCAALPADGGIDEGYLYWWQGACRAFEALDVLAFATGGVLDGVPAAPALRATFAFMHRAHLGDGWFVNAADADARTEEPMPWHMLHRASRRAGDDDARRFAASRRGSRSAAANERAGLGRLLRGMTDASWISEVPASPPFPRVAWFPDNELLIARESEESARGLALAIKGGHNDEHHNHNDIGSFIVSVDGVPVLVDAGRATYRAETFGPNRYDLWNMQSSWHNLPEVRGTAQADGRDYAASDVAVRLGETPELGLDLVGAYPAADLRSWRRAARLEPAGTESAARVVIDDTWDLAPWTDGPEPETTIHLLVAGGLDARDGEAVVAPLDNAPRVRVRWVPPVSPHLERRELDDPLLRGVWGEHLTRIGLPVTGHFAMRVTVELAPDA